MDYLKEGTRVKLLEQYAQVYRADGDATGYVIKHKQDMGDDFYYVKWDRKDLRARTEVDGYVFCHHLEPSDDPIPLEFLSIVEAPVHDFPFMATSFDDATKLAMKSLQNAEAFAIVTLNKGGAEILLDARSQAGIIDLGTPIGELVATYMRSLSSSAHVLSIVVEQLLGQKEDDTDTQ